MWLPKLLYELLPYIYLASGIAFCAWSRGEAPRGLALVAFVAGALLIVLGVLILLRRRAFRADVAKYDPDSLER